MYYFWKQDENYFHNTFTSIMKNTIITATFTDQKESLKSIINNFQNEGYILGNQDRNEIRVINLGAIELNIKSFKKPNIINKIAYGYLRKSKAERSYKYASILKNKKIGTPTPIAYFENKDLLGLNSSYYISEHINVDLTFRELVTDPEFPDHDTILRKFVHFTHSLHENNILFNDHSPGNTLIKKINNVYHFYLVDLNRMTFKALDFNERMKNFSRLTPKKEMIQVMSDEYAKITGENFDSVFNEMWKQTESFQEKFFRKKRLKRKLKFWKK